MFNTTKKILSVFLAALMIFSVVPMSVFASETTPTVNIVSFMRGLQTNLRSSELLEAHVEGYNGNVRELTYKWKSTLGTYLYIYNSHNMYNINNTDGEIEIHNKDKNISGLSNMVGRTYNKEFSGVGYAWASVYGAGLKGSTSLVGVVTVEVYDKNGKLLCSDTHEGKYSNRKNTGFVTYNLDADMDNVVIGLFEGDKRNVLDLLGESAVVHITCVESFVDNGEIISGTDHIKLTKENGDYYITGTVAGTSTDTTGDAQVDLDISKGNCKFHNDSSGDAITTIFVFKKPTTSTTTTTLTLTGNLDDRCTYFIGGAEGVKQDDGTIIFTGLTPNTSYTVEVRGEYKDNEGNTKYAYAYVYDTTKPVYKATVKTYLDGVLADISDIHGADVTLYLHEKDGKTDNVELVRSEKGTYTAAVENGIYYPWHIEAGDHEHMAREYKLIIENANGELDLHHYTVSYDTNGGSFKENEKVTKEVYSSMAAVKATENVPVLDGYVFAGWEYNGKTYASGSEVTSAISTPITLKAKWEKEVNVTINVEIDHKVDGGFDSNENKDELLVEFLEMKSGSSALVETGDKLYFSKEIVTDEKGNAKPYKSVAKTTVEGDLLVTYTATAPTYTGLLESSSFGVALHKSGYDAVVDKTQDENGDWIINITLTYNPDDFDLDFSVEMDENVPKELYPEAVVVKVACWDVKTNQWVIITQQRTTENTVRPGVRVEIDPETGKGIGSYPVWKYDSDNTPYGYRAVVTGFIYKDSTIVVPTEKDHYKDDNTVIVTYTDGNYTAIMGDVADGKKYSTSLNGAYYNSQENAQQGTLNGVITVESYDVIFDAQGGVNAQGKDIAEKVYRIPELKDYVPTMKNHKFLGWYTDEECTVAATEGELLRSDITLYAKWDRILKGTVIVDGYYKDGENQFPVDDVDRAKYALVELEEITPDGVYNIDGQTVAVEWVEIDHFSNSVSYEFKGLNPDKTYRVDVYLMNYETAYQNITTPEDSDKDIHNDYNTTDYQAVFTQSNKHETFVNILLKFKPENYVQNVVIDSTRIGEGFRPDGALIKYYSEEIGVDDEYVLIVQHKDAEAGVKVEMNTETGKNNGEYGENVWKENYNGNLYNYQAELVKLGGKEMAEWPVIVSYGDPARWSPYNQASTSDLEVTVIPMWYKVIYKWDGYEETVLRGHIWSHETAIDYVPVRDGYVFDGWYANPECTGEAVTKIEASVATDTTLYAKWEKRTDLELTVNYVDKATNEVLETETKTSQTFGDVITAESLNKDFKGYSYDSASAESITIGTGANEITLYYTKNSYPYIVNYLKSGTNEKLAESKISSAVYGETVEENALAIDGYITLGYSNKEIVIDTENNVIDFYYVPISYGYTVNYLEKGTDKVLATAKTASADFASTVAENAIAIDGYSVSGESSKEIVIAKEGNVINFYYTANSYGYTVNYLEKGTDKVLATAKKASANFGSTVTENAIAIDGYSVSDDSAKSIKIAINGNVINFYYTANSYGYTVNYLEKDTNNVLATAKKASANFGSTVTENAIAIDGYSVSGEGTKSIEIAIDGNAINFYYTINSYKYTVNYLEEGSNKVIHKGKTEYAVYGKTVTESAIAIDKYALVSENSKSITITSGTNFINFYYETDKTGGGTDGNTSDNIADKYQKKVIFKVVNGTWKDGTTADKVVYLNLMKDGKYAVDGTAELTSPAGMKANDGFEGGSWDVTPPTSVSGTKTETYTYTFTEIVPDEPEIPDTPDVPENPDEPDTPDTPDTPEIPEGDGEGDNGSGDSGTGSGSVDTSHYIVFGKTNSIGWYKVSLDGGETYQTVFGNSTLEVEEGTEMLIKAGDLVGGSFTFYVNGNAVKPDENNEIRVVVDGYMLIGALSIEVEVPDVEESLNWFQKLIKAIKEFFEELFGKK